MSMEPYTRYLGPAVQPQASTPGEMRRALTTLSWQTLQRNSSHIHGHGCLQGPQRGWCCLESPPSVHPHRASVIKGHCQVGRCLKGMAPRASNGANRDKPQGKLLLCMAEPPSLRTVPAPCHAHQPTSSSVTPSLSYLPGARLLPGVARTCWGRMPGDLLSNGLGTAPSPCPRARAQHRLQGKREKRRRPPCEGRGRAHSGWPSTGQSWVRGAARPGPATRQVASTPCVRGGVWVLFSCGRCQRSGRDCLWGRRVELQEPGTHTASVCTAPAPSNQTSLVTWPDSA